MIQELDAVYMERLQTLAGEIQASEELAKYLDEEEEEDFNELKQLYEPRIGAIYEEVAAKYPLQLFYLEKVLLNSAFEGLYLPRILGYSVLRGEISKDNYKYLLPENHFKDILLTICNSANFDILKKRIGQAIQIGFGMSSDIWITNLMDEVQNKRVRYYLRGHKLVRYRDQKERQIGRARFMRQFRSENFLTAEFPDTLSDLKVQFPALRSFLAYRIAEDYDNTSLIPHLMDFVRKPEFQATDEHMKIMTLFASFFTLEGDNLKELSEIFNKMRTTTPDFDNKYLDFLLEMQEDPTVSLDGAADFKLSAILDKSIKDRLTEFYELTDIIHGKGYINDEVQEAVRVFYNEHEGRSKINKAVRGVIYGYLDRLISNLELSDYPEYFEISKTFTVYMEIFANQQFNQDLKELSMTYIKKLLKRYTDKRAKDYQDIKKFVSAMFPDFGFLKEKEVVELFKTRRKRKKTPTT